MYYPPFKVSTSKASLNIPKVQGRFQVDARDLLAKLSLLHAIDTFRPPSWTWALGTVSTSCKNGSVSNTYCFQGSRVGESLPSATQVGFVCAEATWRTTAQFGQFLKQANRPAIPAPDLHPSTKNKQRDYWCVAWGIYGTTGRLHADGNFSKAAVGSCQDSSAAFTLKSSLPWAFLTAWAVEPLVCSKINFGCHTKGKNMFAENLASHHIKLTRCVLKRHFDQKRHVARISKEVARNNLRWPNWSPAKAFFEIRSGSAFFSRLFFTPTE